MTFLPHLGERIGMTKKVVLALGYLALLTSFAGTAMADAITFSFIFGPPVVIDSTGLTAGPALNVVVSDTRIPTYFTLIGTASISTGAAVPTTYVATSTSLSAQFMPGGANDVLVLSPSCGGVCLAGSFNGDGTYAATMYGTGSFQGLFHVDYVNPYITSLFGDPNAWLATGSDSLNTAFNVFSPHGTSATATLTGGTVTFQTPVPEPGTIALLGAGFLSLAGVVRQKLQ